VTNELNKHLDRFSYASNPGKPSTNRTAKTTCPSDH